MKKLEGKWYYQSFVALPGDVDRTKTPPDVKRPPLIAAPWTPSSVMELSTDAAGAVTGTASLRSVVFKITGTIKAAMGTIPEGVELVVTVEALGATYNLRGYFLSDSDHIVGTVVSVANDLAYQPVGASGPFVLYPVRS